MPNNEPQEKICTHPHCRCMNLDGSCKSFHYGDCNAEFIAYERSKGEGERFSEEVLNEPPDTENVNQSKAEGGVDLISHLRYDTDIMAQMDDATGKINELVDAINRLNSQPINKPYDSQNL